MTGTRRNLIRRQVVRPHAALTQLQVRSRSFMLVEARLHPAVAGGEGGVGDGVGCVSDSSSHLCRVCQTKQASQFVLQGTLKHHLMHLLVGEAMCASAPFPELALLLALCSMIHVSDFQVSLQSVY